MLYTNPQWYPYEEFGSLYKLEGGALYQCPMMADGSREMFDESPGAVDWTCGVEPNHEPRLREIVEELEQRP